MTNEKNGIKMYRKGLWVMVDEDMKDVLFWSTLSKSASNLRYKDTNENFRKLNLTPLLNMLKIQKGFRKN